MCIAMIMVLFVKHLTMTVYPTKITIIFYEKYKIPTQSLKLKVTKGGYHSNYH